MNHLCTLVETNFAPAMVKGRAKPAAKPAAKPVAARAGLRHAPPKPKAKAARVAQNTQKTRAELIQLVTEYQALPRYPAGHIAAGKRIGVPELEIKHKVAPGYISRSKLLERVKNMHAEASPLKRAENPRKGVNTKFTPETQELMAQKALEWNNRFSDQEMADFLTANGVDVTQMGVWKHRQTDGWRETKSKTVPWLTTGEHGHREQRQEFATEHLEETWDAWVDGDEKWFYGLRLHETLKLAPGQEEPPPMPIKSKRFLPKVMHLAAVGRPPSDPRRSRGGIRSRFVNSATGTQPGCTGRNVVCRRGRNVACRTGSNHILTVDTQGAKGGWKERACRFASVGKAISKEPGGACFPSSWASGFAGAATPFS